MDVGKSSKTLMLQYYIHNLLVKAYKYLQHNILPDMPTYNKLGVKSKSLSNNTEAAEWPLKEGSVILLDNYYSCIMCTMLHVVAGSEANYKNFI